MKYLTIKRHKLLLMLATIALSLSACTGSTGSAAPTTSIAKPSASTTAPTLSVGWIADPHFANMYVMPKMVNSSLVHLQMHKFELSPSEITAFSNGSIQMASIAYVSFLKLIQLHVPVTAISGVNTEGSRLLIRKGLSIKHWSDLANLTFGVVPGTTQYLQLQTALAAHGVDPAKIHTVFLSSAVEMLTALKSGSVDAVSLWEPQASQAILDGYGTQFSTLYPYSWSSNSLLIVNPTYLKDHPVAVEAALTGLYKAGKSLTANPSDWVDQTLKFVPLPKSVEQLAIKNCGLSVILHERGLPVMEKQMFADGYLNKKLTMATIDAHINLVPLESATGMSVKQLTTT